MVCTIGTHGGGSGITTRCRQSQWHQPEQAGWPWRHSTWGTTTLALRQDQYRPGYRPGWWALEQLPQGAQPTAQERLRFDDATLLKPPSNARHRGTCSVAQWLGHQRHAPTPVTIPATWRKAVKPQATHKPMYTRVGRVCTGLAITIQYAYAAPSDNC